MLKKIILIICKVQAQEVRMVEYTEMASESKTRCAICVKQGHGYVTSSNEESYLLVSRGTESEQRIEQQG